MSAEYYDVLVVGAGLSGVAAAYFLQHRCPQKSFTILEARDDIGGTWDLFQYPGIRSDSDMHTLGFSFFPWSDPQAIADGPSIMAYLRAAVEEYDLEPKIVFGTRVERASWSSVDSRWTVTVRTASGAAGTYTCSFLWGCTGYYNYDDPYTPEFPGADQFEGLTIHPQHWPEDLDYSGKKIVVIGSGATAVTLLPALASQAAHVTMLQRSPTYVLSIPGKDRVSDGLKAVLGERFGSAATRWKNVLRIMFFYNLARRSPDTVRRYLIKHVRDELGDDYDMTHFTPRYNPWDQRVCFVPDGDMFDAIKSGRVSVVTDNVERFTAGGIELKSGTALEADIIVTATGLRLQVLGGTTIEVDGVEINPGDQTMYKGSMLSNVPNAAVSIGYTNASWTLKCELISEYVCRLLEHMDRHGHTRAWPRPPADLEPVPLLNFNSGYVLRALDEIPKQGDRAPWRLHQNYLLDQFVLRRRPVDDGVIEFS